MLIEGENKTKIAIGKIPVLKLFKKTTVKVEAKTAIKRGSEIEIIIDQNAS